MPHGAECAEGFLEDFAGNEIVAVSTAVESVKSDPLTHEVMKEVGIDISGQHPQEVANRSRNTSPM